MMSSTCSSWRLARARSDLKSHPQINLSANSKRAKHFLRRNSPIFATTQRTRRKIRSLSWRRAGILVFAVVSKKLELFFKVKLLERIFCRPSSASQRSTICAIMLGSASEIARLRPVYGKLLFSVFLPALSPIPSSSSQLTQYQLAQRHGRVFGNPKTEVRMLLSP
jgi:hypothetical protein